MTPVSTDSILNSSRSQNLARSGNLPNVRDATQLGSPPDSEVFPVLFNGEDIVMPSSSSNTLMTHSDNLGVDLSNGMVDPPPPVRSPRIITPQTIDPHSGRSYTSPPGSCMTHTIPSTIHDLLPPSTAMMSQAVEDPYAGASPHWIPKHFPPEDDVFLTSSLKDGDFLFSPRPLPGSTMSNAPAADGDDMPLAGLSRLTMRTESPSVSPVPSLLSNSDFGLTHSPVDSVSVKEDEPELPRLTRLQNSDTRFDNPIPFVPSHPGSAAEYSIRDIPRAHENGLSPISERTELNSVPGTPVTHSRHFQPLPRPFLRPEPQHVSMDRPGQRSHGIYTFSPNTPTYQPLTFQYTGSHSSSNASTFHPFSTLVLPPTHSQSFQSVSQTLATQQLQLRQLLAQSPHSQVFSTHAHKNKPTGPTATLNNDPVVPSEVETKNHESSLNPNSHFQSPLPSAFPAMAQLPLSPLASMPLRAANPTGHSTIKNHTGSSPNPYPPGFASYPGYPMSFNIYPHDRVLKGEPESAHHSYIPSNPVPLTFDRSIPVPRNRPTLDIPRGRFYFEDGNVIFSVKNEKLYRVHRSFFGKSPVLSSRIQDYRPTTTTLEDYPPILLTDVETNDFELMLATLYPDEMEIESSSEWAAVLRVASLYQMPSLTRRASQELARIASPTEMILLSTDNRFRGTLIPFAVQAFLTLITDNLESVPKEDIEMLGPKISYMIGDMQSELRGNMKKYLDQKKVTSMVERKLSVYEVFDCAPEPDRIAAEAGMDSRFARSSQ